ncbi:DUF4266 domain-containing protein [Massilia sp. TS11]|uniref:DUF4266 domain-containing protein n=1 Tax=Massilia sp. TS11 TaxID=2908003 RepID=UPI001EDA7530|nr:DUF4266 domain-containing protein [Massilia sp. TS11]MCG2583760.1 DUF4266 domain-containing protein [Massilia sp. TS11]
MNLKRTPLVLALGAALAGCGTLEPVQPWQKGILSKPEMRFAGDRLEQTFNEHIYASREGASGGNGANGGGCGCY